jgi:CRISPR-associated protein Csb2
MPSICFTVRFLQGTCHGRADAAEPEWPPSPLRAYQALIAAAAAAFNERTRIESTRTAFHAIESLDAPLIVAPEWIPGSPYRLSVPNNAMDVVAGAWSRGNYSNQGDANPATHRSMKTVRPTHIVGDDFPAVHFVWPVPDDQADALRAHFATLRDAARSVTHLGWGVDMAVGDAVELDDAGVARLDGERWQPVGGGVSLRVPRRGTFDALVARHTAFLGRLNGGGFTPVPPLTDFDTVGYRRATDPVPRQYAAFRILAEDPDAKTPSFDTPRRCREVAAWVRNATARVWGDRPDLASFVHGHSEGGAQLTGPDADRRFMYLPLPTIEMRPTGHHVGAIRRVLVAAPPDCGTEVEFVRQRLAGEVLEWNGTTFGMLTGLQVSDWVLGRYVGESAEWTTVTPVLLHRHSDRRGREVYEFLRTAFVQSGLSQDLVDRAEFDWRAAGFLPGVELASRYLPPENHMHRQRCHVRVRFPQAIRGPLTIGAGRYRGFGVFAAVG